MRLKYKANNNKIMKTTIITIIAAFLSISTSFGGNTIHKNVEGRKEAGTVTTTVYNGTDNRDLVPFKQTVFEYNTDKNLKERISYKWDSNTQQWLVVSKYKYEYNINGELINISYLSWNESSNSWNKDVQYAMYIYDKSNESSPVKYLSVTDSNKKY